MHSDQMNNIHAPSIIRHADSRVESLSEGQLAVPVQINRGSMVNDARKYIYANPIAILWPALAIATLVIGVNLFADGLREELTRYQQ